MTFCNKPLRFFRLLCTYMHCTLWNLLTWWMKILMHYFWIYSVFRPLLVHLQDHDENNMFSIFLFQSIWKFIPGSYSLHRCYIKDLSSIFYIFSYGTFMSYIKNHKSQNQNSIMLVSRLYIVLCQIWNFFL